MRSPAAQRHVPGTLVHARGRDWVVLPSDEPDVLRLRALTGQEEAGLYLPLEGAAVQEASFPPPDPALAGDATGGLLLRDAARLLLRDGAAPFRSLGCLSVTPRPYQFVPLIMALRIHPVRLLIADDVGVGKTIEAALIARELLDRGIARRLAVLCPAHLCEQWEAELREKFGLGAAVIQPSRMGRLERDLPRQDLSIYQYYRHLVASIDFVKSDRHRGPFLDNAPDLVIVDEAHIAARPRGGRDRVQHQRYELLRALAADPGRHLILVTATPHAGVEESFRSLLGLLNPEFDPEPGGSGPDLDRRRLLPHVVQRRRSDLQQWLGETTPFPERQAEERTYVLSPAYEALFNEALAYCRESLRATGLGAHQRRVRHWAAIAVLRCVLSSPEAAVAVLANRARKEGLEQAAKPETEDEVDAAYRPQVLDPMEEEEAGDYVPTAPLEDAEPTLAAGERRRLESVLRRARTLAGPEADAKLAAAAAAAGDLLQEGHRPIVFCRFIATARYLEHWLPRLLGPAFPGVRVAAVTSELGEEERRARVEELAQEPVRVLVATDCLSEGINLQEHFDAVVHYDLPWNPNRLEQREGRVDRFGQPRPAVKAVLLYGTNNPVDLAVLDVLVRKARTIRRELGVSVPVPVESEQVLQAVVDSVLLRGPSPGLQLQLGLTDPEVSRLHQRWDAAAAREREQRTFFAQHGIQPDEVARELAAVDPVLGDAEAVRRFLANALQRLGGELRPARPHGAFELLPGELAPRLQALGYGSFPLRVVFDRPADPTAEYLGRTHPIVAACCEAVLGRALAPGGDNRFARCGAVFTRAVSLRTGVALLRFRYRLLEETEQYAEEVVLAAFQRQDGALRWLEPLDGAAELLEAARPAANMSPAERREHVAWALELLHGPADVFAPLAARRAEQVAAAHARVRRLAGARPLEVRPHLQPDVLGCYVLVPAGGAAP